ncbi:MAG TPA: ABC transporter ATP-binding protein, partial [Alphaproteobacteria bacterium]|nr:ABC transporter ATP-binding protein [Alphaproteobacteria bacterium]
CDISLHVESGARHALIGPNGAGKTTLFNLLTGEIRADSGSITLAGKDLTRARPDIRARLGMARSYQQNNLFADLTVTQNLVTALVVARGYGLRLWQRLSDRNELALGAVEIAELIGLADVLDEPAHRLAYGMKRQLEVGLALAVEPKLLLLDEPTAGMSPDETKLMLTLIGSLPPTLTVLIIEHDMDVVFQFAERITVLDEGAVLFEGSPDEVHCSDVVRARYLKLAT